MTYSIGGLIEAVDYNGFVSTTSGGNINAVWNTSYGQTALGTVSAAGTVTATQWATLNNTLTSIGAHQATTLTSRTSPVAGNTIAVLSNLGTDCTSVNTNKLNAAAQGSQYTAWTGTSSKTSATGSARRGDGRCARGHPADCRGLPRRCAAVSCDSAERDG